MSVTHTGYLDVGAWTHDCAYGPWTLCTWVYPSNAGADQNHLLAWGFFGDIQFNTNTGNPYNGISMGMGGGYFGRQLVNNRWQHLVFTRVNFRYICYVDGVRCPTSFNAPANTYNFPNVAGAGSNVFLIYTGVGGGGYNARLRDFGLFRDGCGSEQALLMAKGSPAPDVLDNCQGYWPFRGSNATELARDHGPKKLASSWVGGSATIFTDGAFNGQPAVFRSRRYRRKLVANSIVTYSANASLSMGALTFSGSGTFTKPTYTAASAVTLPALLTAGSGTFTKPVYTASANLLMFSSTPGGGGGSGAEGPIYITASGTFTKPTYAATSAVSIAPLTLAGVGTFTTPTYTGSASLTLPALIESSSGTFVKPIYTATGSQVLGPLTLSGTGTFQTSIFTGVGVFSLGPQTLNGTGSFTSPVYEATGSLAIAPLTLQGSATFTTPTYEGTSNLLMAAIVVSAQATSVNPTYTASATVSLGPETLTASGTFTNPTYTATSSVSLASLSLAGSGTFTQPVYTASLSSSLGPLTFTGSATYQAVFVASAGVTLGALTTAIVAWLNPPVYYLEWTDSGISTVVDFVGGSCVVIDEVADSCVVMNSLEGSSILTTEVPGDCKVVDAVTGSLRLRLTTDQ